jgi:hypothetical protein
MLVTCGSNEPRVCILRACLTTAGIGKSMFGYYVLWRWACRGERVVLRKDQYEDEEPFLLCADGAFQLDKVQWQREGRNPATR